MNDRIEKLENLEKQIHGLVLRVQAARGEADLDLQEVWTGISARYRLFLAEWILAQKALQQKRKTQEAGVGEERGLESIHEAWAEMPTSALIRIMFFEGKIVAMRGVTEAVAELDRCFPTPSQASKKT